MSVSVLAAQPYSFGTVTERRSPSPALLTDLYELTMAAAYLDEGMADRRATFSLFVRGLPAGRGCLVAAGLEDALRWLEELRFTGADLDALRGLELFDEAFLDLLAGLRFDGDVRAVPEGTPVFSEEPILEVDAPMAVAQIAESYLLNQVTTQTTLATKAARARHAARGTGVLDFALRRTHGVDAAMKLARVCGLVGLAGTSNVAGALEHGVPASGTMAHSFVQAHESELGAFRAFAARYGDATVLLVDTYDTITGVERAIEVGREMRERGEQLRGIRLDSGDLAELSRRARKMLDDAGLSEVRIFASGGLDEHEVDRLLHEESAPIDGWGLGSALGVSKDVPVLDSVYKLVEYAGRPVRKTSEGKAIWPGPKQVWRRTDGSGDVLGRAGEDGPAGSRPLLAEVMRSGERTDAGRVELASARERFEAEWAALPAGVKRLSSPEPYPVEVSDELRALAEEVDAARAG